MGGLAEQDMKVPTMVSSVFLIDFRAPVPLEVLFVCVTKMETQLRAVLGGKIQVFLSPTAACHPACSPAMESKMVAVSWVQGQ